MPKSTLLIALALVATFVLAQSSTRKKASPARPNTTAPTKVTGDSTKTPSGLEYWDIKLGTGPTAEKGQTVKVHYTGWLTTGKKFDSSVDSGRPFSFTLGAGEVIKGWDEGVPQMTLGEKAKLTITPYHPPRTPFITTSSFNPSFPSTLSVPFPYSHSSAFSLIFSFA